MRVPIIAGNWKMNTTVAEAVDLVHNMLNDIEDVRGVEVVLCPPYVSLYPVYEQLRGGPVELGAQNVEYRNMGAYTGEIAALMLAPICKYVIIGHSERRQYYGETDETVNLRIKTALGVGLTPIICVGERLEENEAGKTEEVLERQVRAAYDGLKVPGMAVIAYEPVWAIGTGKAATAEQANTSIGFIRKVLGDIYSPDLAETVRIQYGGSVTAANAEALLGQPEIDGALVGGASLKGPDFVAICKAAAATSSLHQK